jgi:hypothetical protein
VRQLFPEQPLHFEPPPEADESFPPRVRAAKADICFTRSKLPQDGHFGISEPITRVSNSFAQSRQMKSNNGIRTKFIIFF